MSQEPTRLDFYEILYELLRNWAKSTQATFNENQKYHPEVKNSIQREHNTKIKGLLKIKWPKATFNERQKYHPEVKSNIQREHNAKP